MGIQGLLRLINENKEAFCTEPRCLRGELVVDGYGVLHMLYEVHNLDWANGGCYAQQHKITVDYFEALVRAGVKPIVVVDGGGCAVQHNDTVYRRKKDIKNLPDQLVMHHEKLQKLQASHIVPIMAREVFISSLREKNIDVYVADGKATKTIVCLANYYRCPILTNTTNYCVCDVAGGVVFFEHLDIKTCKSNIYEQTRLVEFCKLRNPDLVYAIVAIVGDGSDTSVPYFYHGRIKRQIEGHIMGTDLRGRSKFLNVADFLRVKKFPSFGDFKSSLRSLNFGRQWESLLENCQKAEKVYNYSSANKLSTDELNVSTTIKCSQPCDLPISVLQSYRSGTFPVLIINAITLGECVLEQVVGDQQQPPPSMLGLPVRQLMYGLASSLMKEEDQAAIKEFHRSINGSLVYEAHNVTPTCKCKELSITNLSSLDEKSRTEMAVQAICEVLECPEDIVQTLDNETDKSLIIAAMVTHFWAKHLIQKEPMPYPNQLIKALVVNFFFNLSDPEAHRQSVIDDSKFSDPNWVKVYHALLEWQGLYRDVCSLNFMLLQPLTTLPSSYLFDGPLIFFLALHPSPQIIDTYVSKLDPKKAAQYVKILELVIM